MKASAAIAGRAAGTLTVAAPHEALRRVTPDAPRMDILDMELIRQGLKSLHREVPDENELQRWAVGGELLADTAYCSVTEQHLKSVCPEHCHNTRSKPKSNETLRERRPH